MLLTAMLCSCGESVVQGSPDSGTRSAIDPRFRGVGARLSRAPFIGATGGVLAGVGTSSAFWQGNGLLSWGATAADFITVYGVQVADGEPSSVRLWTAGRDCSTAFSGAVDGGAVILAMSGDLLGQTGTCTLFGTEVPGFSNSSAAAAIADLPAAARALGSRGAVLTAVAELDAGQLLYVASTRDAGELFGTEVVRTSSSGLAGELDALADAGFYLTASTYRDGMHTLVGTRPGDATARVGGLWVTDPSRLDADSANLLDAGFAPVALTLGERGSDGGLILYLIGEK